jgi:hypothetical protein
MKQLLYICFTSIIILAVFGCSEKDNNPTDVQVYGYKLEQFINQSLVADLVDAEVADTSEFRGLFAYEIVSTEDGFSPRMSSYAGYDLPWETFKEGYLVPSDNNKTWFADVNLPGAFRVRNAGIFRLYRKIDVVAPDNSSKLVELGGLPVYTVDNWDGNPEEAIKLSDLIQGYAAYDSISIVCYDDYGIGKYYQPEAVEDGYYLLTTERTIFPTASLPTNQKKMKKVSYIQVFGSTSEQSHEFDLTPSDFANLIFTVPADLSGYAETPLPDYPE